MTFVVVLDRLKTDAVSICTDGIDKARLKRENSLCIQEAGPASGFIVYL